MNNKKIFSILWGYKPGGVTEYVKHISKADNLEIYTIIIQKEGWGNDFSGFEHGKYHLISFKSFFHFRWLKKLIDFLKNRQPDLIYAHSFNGAIVTALALGISKLNIPFVCSYHGKYLAPTKTKKFVEQLYNFLVYSIYRKFSNAVVCVSEFSKKELLANGVPSNKIKVIYNGIHHDVSKVSAPVFHSPNFRQVIDDNFIIGTVCRLVPLKGIDLLIKATQKTEGVILLVIGDGPYIDLLESIAGKDKDSKIFFVGERMDIPNWLDLMNLFVLPSYVENHSISILEAMRQGKPVIATDVGGNSESVRNRIEGLIVPPGDVLSLKNAIIELKCNPKLLTEMGQRARERFLNKFTDVKMLRDLESYLIRVCSKYNV